jgi:hypothetical protein
MYYISNIRLIAVGPSRRPFRDSHIDLSAEPPSVTRPPAGTARSQPPGSAALVVGDNGAGKTLIAQLVKLVVAPLPVSTAQAWFVECLPVEQIGHVLLAWEDRQSGERLITGLASKRRGEAEASARYTYYSFSLANSVELQEVPFRATSTFQEAIQHMKVLEAEGIVRELATFDNRASWSAHLAARGLTTSCVHLISNDGQIDSTNTSLRAAAKSGEIFEKLIRNITTDTELAELTELKERARARGYRDAAISDLAKLVHRCLESLRHLEALSSLPTNQDPHRSLVRFAIDLPTEKEIQERISFYLKSNPTLMHYDPLTMLVESARVAVNESTSVSILGSANRQIAASEHTPFGRWGHLSGGQIDLFYCALDILAARLRVTRERGTEAPLAVFVDSVQVTSLSHLIEIARPWGVQIIHLSARVGNGSPEVFDRVYQIGLHGEDQVASTAGTVIREATTLAAALSRHARIPTQLNVLEEVQLDEIFRVLAPSEQPEDGDFLVPQFRWAGAVGAVQVYDGVRTLHGLQSEVRLRPRVTLDPSEQEYYVRFLGSDALLGHGADAGQLVTIRAADLEAAPLLRPDRETLHAMAELTHAGATFAQWQREATSAADAFFWQHDVAAGRAAIITAGRLTRQRRETAYLLDEHASRIRATMPFPIASRWRTVEAARPDEAGYRRILDCAETAVTYCAAVGAQLAIAQPGVVNLQALSAKLRQGAPLPWGAWTSLLSELGRAGSNFSLPADSPLRNYRLVVNEVDGLVRSLKQRRNDLAHQRVPPPHRIAAHAEEAKTELERLLAATEWLSDYPLRHIEEVRWDSFADTSVIHFRELMGDHHIVTLKAGATSGNLEVFSPYVADQFGRYHLLRPLFHSEHCASCGQLSLFILDRWIESEQSAEYKALDHSDVCRVPAGNALRGVGLLPR